MTAARCMPPLHVLIAFELESQNGQPFDASNLDNRHRMTEDPEGNPPDLPHERRLAIAQLLWKSEITS